MKINKFITIAIALSLFLQGCGFIGEKITYELGEPSKSDNQYFVPFYIDTEKEIYGFSGNLENDSCDKLILEPGSKSLIFNTNVSEGKFMFSAISSSKFKILDNTKPILSFRCNEPNIKVEEINIVDENLNEITL